MKVIDLLVKIANCEEVPKKLLYKFKNGNFYEEYLLKWDDKYNAYFYISNNDNENHSIVDLLADNLWNLNDEVEIIEGKPKKIEELDVVRAVNDNYYVLDKILELIHISNCLMEKSDKE